jgi:hypothetical protein
VRCGLDRGIAAKTEAIERVDRHASEDWKTACASAITEAARRWTRLTSDQVWEVLAERGVTEPHEPRAMGPMMVQAVRLGVLKATDDWEPSVIPARHRRPCRVYESLIWKESQ